MAKHWHSRYLSEGICLTSFSLRAACNAFFCDEIILLAIDSFSLRHFRIDYLFTMQRLMLSKFLKDFFPIIKTRILVSLEANSLTEGWYSFCCALPFIEQHKLRHGVVCSAVSDDVTGSLSSFTQEEGATTFLSSAASSAYVFHPLIALLWWSRK